jgi:hypothetical protein
VVVLLLLLPPQLPVSWYLWGGACGVLLCKLDAAAAAAAAAATWKRHGCPLFLSFP